jgi:hypothetical protein
MANDDQSKDPITSENINIELNEEEMKDVSGGLTNASIHLTNAVNLTNAISLTNATVTGLKI